LIFECQFGLYEMKLSYCQHFIRTRVLLALFTGEWEHGRLRMTVMQSLRWHLETEQSTIHGKQANSIGRPFVQRQVNDSVTKILEQRQ
jgi:hypothetical protein